MGHFGKRSFRARTTPGMSRVKNDSYKKWVTYKMVISKIVTSENESLQNGHFENGYFEKFVTSGKGLPKIDHFENVSNRKGLLRKIDNFENCHSEKLITSGKGDSENELLWKLITWKIALFEK